MSLANGGLAILPDAFSNRVWAGGKLTWYLGPRPRRKDIAHDLVRITENVESLEPRNLAGDKPMFKLTRRFVYRVNVEDSPPLLVEERTHAFMPEGIPRRVRKVDNLPPVTVQSHPITPDAIALFQYSAATHNAHRIHYDYRFAQQEGFEDVVVHGPLTASLLLHLLMGKKPSGVAVHSFEYRNTNALYVDRPLTLCIALEASTGRVFDPSIPIPEQHVLQYERRDPRDERYRIRSQLRHAAFRSENGYETGYNVRYKADLWAVDAAGVVGMRATAILVDAPPQRLDGFGLKLSRREKDNRYSRMMTARSLLRVLRTNERARRGRKPGGGGGDPLGD
ncbi:hypothetical protein EXIGLDRAFT_752155 [Exidia glandulosa HHB12029]|uniref:MaoC-like domain-containing protein n=1 Tax=Exidia glandulosa HHB12029 TaxID=1314781 RepID=A0A165ESJ7_EXIGL|nr:hypothetical protein EXIGLDRAFT_752155 [Exidia glandulosa HHB12029]